jgi:hypothetical protein
MQQLKIIQLHNHLFIPLLSAVSHMYISENYDLHNVLRCNCEVEKARLSALSMATSLEIQRPSASPEALDSARQSANASNATEARSETPAVPQVEVEPNLQVLNIRHFGLAFPSLSLRFPRYVIPSSLNFYIT